MNQYKMETQIIKLESPELALIEKSKAEQIKNTFEPMVKMLKGFDVAFIEITKEADKELTQETTMKAKRLRLDVGKVRIDTEKIRKEQKEEYLRAGKAIDGVSNILKWAVTDKENRLKEIEDHFEIKERQRLEKLQSKRVGLLSKYIEDAHERNLSGMEEDVWNAYLTAKKKEYEDRIAAEKKAEEDRIAKEKAEAEEREHIRIDNIRLRKEAEENEKLAKIEEAIRQKAEKERLAKEESERQTREKKLEAERRLHEEKMKAEQLAREKIEGELRAKQEAEEKAEKERLTQIEVEANKGDEDKVNDLLNDFKVLKTKYVFTSKGNKKMYEDVKTLIDKIINHVTA